MDKGELMEEQAGSFQIRVLLVDDSDYDQTAFRRWLNAVPDLYKLKEYGSAEDVLADDELSLGEFDVLVVDNYLPGMSGLQLGKELRSRGATGSMVLMTGSGSQQLVIDALTGGFDDYVIKDLEGSYLKMLPTVLANNFQRSRDRKAAEESQRLLEENEAKYRGFFENATDLMFSVDGDGKYTFVNKAWVDKLGYKDQPGEGVRIFDAIHHEDREYFLKLFERAKLGESLQDVEVRFVSASGHGINALGSLVCRVAEGVPCGASGIFMDISSRKEIENEMSRLNEALEQKVEERTRSLSEKVEELKRESKELNLVSARLEESEDRIRTIVEHAPEAILVLDVEKDRFVDCNARARSLFKMSREELLQCSPGFIVPTDGNGSQDDIRKEKIAQAVAGESISFTTRRRDSEARVFPCEIRMVRLPSKESVLVRSSIIDISEREKAESERNRLMVAIEQIEEMVVVVDQDNRIVYTNPAFEKTTGYTNEEAVGQLVRRFFGEESDEALHLEIGEKLAAGELWRGQMVSLKKDGSQIVEEGTITPVKNAAGEFVNYVGILRDITEQLELERRLGIAQRMESIGTLAGGIAHDFNNILAGIIGYTDLALGSVSPGGETHEFLSEIAKASDRAKTLVLQILECGRQGSPERKAIELQPILKEAIELLRKAIPATIAIESRIDADCRKVYADPTRIHQVVMNLCTNSFHAVQESEGVIEVSLEEVMVDSELAVVENLDVGPYVCLSVRDNGYGMDETTLARIFDPYFTTKEVGEGTGLGLATVMGIVKKHGGTILVQSKPQEGAVFEVLLPVIENEEELAERESEKNVIAQVGLGERLLLVDDDAALLSASRRSLERIGYNLTVFSDVEEALEAFRASPEDFDLVITDYAMPKMNGMALSARLLEIRADIPIILCSGYSDKVREKQARGAGLRAYMMKPVSAVTLANKIRSILDENCDSRV